jgi:3-hydroxybutyryl-CoA dehydrogenase
MTEVQRVAVIGAGTMGHGIAQVSAACGNEVVLYDIDLGIVDRGLARIRANLDKGVSLGKVTREEGDAILDRITLSSEIGMTVGSADVVIEAAPERMELKRQIFTQVEANAPASALLGTNTSSLSIEKLASSLRDPTRLVGLHFFNPVHIMKLVEVVCGPETSQEARDRGVAFARSLGKEPIVVKDAPGFASSRLGIILGLEAMRMVEQGVASPADIDKAMELGYRHPMGPLRLTDLVGLDVRLGISEYLFETLGSEAFRPPEILKRMVQEGKLGRKSGQGFYSWHEENS